MSKASARLPLYFDGEFAPSVLQIAENDDRVLSVNSFSNAWAMTGWRIGWLSHPVGVADQFAAMTQYTNSGTAVLREGEPDSKAACAKVLEAARVGLAPGYLFGDASRAFLRKCVMRDAKEFQTALDRMVAALG